MTVLSVGSTPLLKINKLCTKFNLPNLFIKDESKNPFGTIKDRRTEFIAKKAVDASVDKLVLITSGNDGYSLSKFCEGTKVKVVNVVDKATKESIKEKLRTCGIVVEKDLSQRISSEELINIAREKSSEVVWDVCTGFFDAHESLFNEIKNPTAPEGQGINNGFFNAKKIPRIFLHMKSFRFHCVGNSLNKQNAVTQPSQATGYFQQIMEVNPSLIILPVGSGNTFVSLYNSVKKHKMTAKLIGVTSKNTLHSFADKLANPFPAYETEYKQMLAEGHQLIKLSEPEIESAYEEFKDLFVCEPSSTVVFAALKKLNLRPKETVVVINSGRGIV